MGTVLALAVVEVLAAEEEEEDLPVVVLDEDAVPVTGQTGIPALDVVELLPVVGGFFPKQSPLLHFPPAQ